MSDLQKLFIGMVFTIIAGVVVYVAQKYIDQMWATQNPENIKISDGKNPPPDSDKSPPKSDSDYILSPEEAISYSHRQGYTQGSASHFRYPSRR